MSSPEPSYPELAIFDPRATRGAVVRGLVRTAMLVGAAWLAFLFLGELTGYALFRLHDRNGAFDRVGLTGYEVGHPGVVMQTSTLGRGEPESGWRGSSQRVVTGRSDYRIRMSVWGDLTADRRAEDDVDRALREGEASRAQSTAFVEGLPAAAVTDAVVSLRAPMDDTRAVDVLEDLDLHVTRSFYDDPFAGARHVFRQDGNGAYMDGDGLDRSVSWDGVGIGFYSWTNRLRPGDDSDLQRLGLPTSTRLKELGRLSQVHGWYVQDLSPAKLKALLASDVVDAITPTAVRFDILDRDQS